MKNNGGFADLSTFQVAINFSRFPGSPSFSPGIDYHLSQNSIDSETNPSAFQSVFLWNIELFVLLKVTYSISLYSIREFLSKSGCCNLFNKHKFKIAAKRTEGNTDKRPATSGKNNNFLQLTFFIASIHGLLS